MALNPRSYGLAQIQYLVASINRKNYKGNTSEITTVRHGWVGINKRSWYLLSIGDGVFYAETLPTHLMSYCTLILSIGLFFRCSIFTFYPKLNFYGKLFSRMTHMDTYKLIRISGINFCDKHNKCENHENLVPQK